MFIYAVFMLLNPFEMTNPQGLSLFQLPSPSPPAQVPRMAHANRSVVKLEIRDETPKQSLHPTCYHWIGLIGENPGNPDSIQEIPHIFIYFQHI